MRIPAQRGSDEGKVATSPRPVPSVASTQPPTASRSRRWSTTALRSPATTGAGRARVHSPISASSPAHRPVHRGFVGAEVCTAYSVRVPSSPPVTSRCGSRMPSPDPTSRSPALGAASTRVPRWSGTPRGTDDQPR